MDDNRIVELYLLRDETAIKQTTEKYGSRLRSLAYGVELVNRTGEHEKYYMPYYRFYVELPDEARDNGLKTYGAYYVPAVESTYISNMPTWDGSFNK